MPAGSAGPQHQCHILLIFAPFAPPAAAGSAVAARATASSRAREVESGRTKSRRRDRGHCRGCSRATRGWLGNVGAAPAEGCKSCVRPGARARCRQGHLVSEKKNCVKGRECSTQSCSSSMPCAMAIISCRSRIFDLGRPACIPRSSSACMIRTAALQLIGLPCQGVAGGKGVQPESARTGTHTHTQADSQTRMYKQRVRDTGAHTRGERESVLAYSQRRGQKSKREGER